MAKMPPLIRIGFTQGNKSSLDPYVVPPNALWKSRNLRVDESGVLRIRRGYRTFIDLPSTGIIQGAVSAFGDILIVHEKKLYRVKDDGTHTEIGDVETKSDDTLVSMIPWVKPQDPEDKNAPSDEVVYILSGNGIYETDGETINLVEPHTPEPGEQPNLLEDEESEGEQNLESGPAKCTIGLVRESLGQRMIVTGNPDWPNTIWMTDPMQGNYYPAVQTINLPNDGSKIVSIAIWYGALIIFRDRDIWAYLRSNELEDGISLVLQDGSVGCTSHRSVVAVPGEGLLFLGGPEGKPDNIYSMRNVQAIEGQVYAAPIANDIQKALIDALSHGTVGVSATYFDNEYRLSIPQNLGEDRVFRLSLRGSIGWYVDSGPRTSQFIPHNGELYAAKWDRAEIIKFSDDWLLDGTDGIPYYVAFRKEDLQPGPSRIKKLYLYVASKGRRTQGNITWLSGALNSHPLNESAEEEVPLVVGTNQTLNVTLLIDGQEFEVKTLKVVSRRTQTLAFGEYEPMQVYEARFRPSLKGHTMQIRIEATTPEEDIALLGYGIEYATRGRIHGSRRGVTV